MTGLPTWAEACAGARAESGSGKCGQGWTYGWY